MLPALEQELTVDDAGKANRCCWHEYRRRQVPRQIADIEGEGLSDVLELSAARKTEGRFQPLHEFK